MSNTDLFNPLVVSDYVFQKCLLFAKVNLPDAEFELFSKLSGYDTPVDVHLAYLVATVDPDGRILAKEVYQTKIAFSDGMETVRKKEEVVVFIPSHVKTNLRGYKILIGFELTESQLQYNKGFR